MGKNTTTKEILHTHFRGSDYRSNTLYTNKPKRTHQTEEVGKKERGKVKKKDKEESQGRRKCLERELIQGGETLRDAVNKPS